MPNKGFILALIIVLSQLAFTLIQMQLMTYYDLYEASPDLEGYTKTLSHFLFILRLVLPVIIITQFRRRDFYKLLGISLMIIAVMQYLVTLTFGYVIYEYLGLSISMINIVVLVVFSIMAFKQPDLKVTAIMLSLLLAVAVFSNYAVVWTLNERLNVPGGSLVSVTINLLLFYSAMIAKVFMVIKESNKIDKENIGLI